MDEKNKLYFGDNLKILRDHVADASVDLIYLDPPFNSSANYNVLFKEKSGEESAAQITAFEDTLPRDFLLPVGEMNDLLSAFINFIL
jgi:site-specific DNA-methyltransferase (adenine-specific)